MPKQIDSYEDLEETLDEELDAFWKALEESCKNLNNEFWNEKKDCTRCSECKICGECKHYSLLNDRCIKHCVRKERKDTCKDWEK
jgi:hypothetical protein